MTVSEINSSNWSMGMAGQGAIVEDVAEINQTIGIILSTRKWSDPFRPTFGSDIWDHIDSPLNVAGPRMVRAIVEAIERWEPRIILDSVTYLVAAQNTTTPDSLIFSISWRLKSDTELKSVESVAIFDQAVPNNIIRVLGTEDGRAVIANNNYISV